MGSLSDFAEAEVLDHIMGVGAYTAPSTVYVGLSTADPLDTSAGLAEPSGNNYARVAVTYGSAASRAITNSGTVTFPQASGSWGTVTHWAIFTALTSGSILAHGSLSASRAIVSGNTPSFAASELDVSFSSGGISDYLANKILDFLFRNQAFTQPTIYAGLATASIADATTGATVTECSGNAYARKAHSAWDAAHASGGYSANTSAITFTSPSGSWGTISHNFLVDSVTAGAGNILFYSVQTPNQTPASGDTVQFATGAWDVVLS